MKDPNEVARLRGKQVEELCNFRFAIADLQWIGNPILQIANRKSKIEIRDGKQKKLQARKIKIQYYRSMIGYSEAKGDCQKFGTDQLIKSSSVRTTHRCARVEKIRIF